MFMSNLVMEGKGRKSPIDIIFRVNSEQVATWKSKLDQKA